MQNNFQGIQVLFLALLLGQLFFGAVVFYLVYTGSAPDSNVTMLNTVAPIVLLGSFITAWIFNQQYKGKGASIVGEEAKLNHYRNRVLVRCAIAEIGVFFIIVAAMVNSNTTLLYMALGGIALFVLFRPTQQELASDYDS